MLLHVIAGIGLAVGAVHVDWVDVLELIVEEDAEDEEDDNEKNDVLLV